MVPGSGGASWALCCRRCPRPSTSRNPSSVDSVAEPLVWKTEGVVMGLRFACRGNMQPTSSFFFVLCFFFLQKKQIQFSNPMSDTPGSCLEKSNGQRAQGRGVRFNQLPVPVALWKFWVQNVSSQRPEGWKHEGLESVSSLFHGSYPPNGAS